MIARIEGYQGRPEFVALHLAPRTEDVWVTVRGDRGRSGEVSEMAAAKLCAKALERQLAPAIDASRELHKLCDRRDRAPSLERKRRILELAGLVTEVLESAGANLARLLDEPTADDPVDIDATYYVSGHP